MKTIADLLAMATIHFPSDSSHYAPPIALACNLAGVSPERVAEEEQA
ncbi:hypothetical protein [Stutzerimonas stutzeri]|nr:hypothetical protein [Stutzerimonas stutzeri]MBA1263216.1 hypothetical protein [Stutzerimonas stutzeri]